MNKYKITIKQPKIWMMKFIKDNYTHIFGCLQFYLAYTMFIKNIIQDILILK